MTQKEIKSFLREHLKIELCNYRENYKDYLRVVIKIDGEEIDSSVNYDFEI